MSETSNTSAPTPNDLKRGVATQKFRNRQAKVFKDLQTVREAPVLVRSFQSKGWNEKD